MNNVQEYNLWSAHGVHRVRYERKDEDSPWHLVSDKFEPNPDFVPTKLYFDERYPDGRPVEPHKNQMPMVPGGSGVGGPIPAVEAIEKEREGMEPQTPPAHKVGNSRTDTLSVGS